MQSSSNSLIERLSVPWVSLALGFGFLFLCYFVAGLFAPTLTSTFYQGPTENNAMLGSPEGQNVFRFVQSITAIVIWGLSATFWANYTGGFRWRLGIRDRTWSGFFPLAALTTLVAFPFVQELIVSSKNFALPEFLSDWETWMKETERNAKQKYELLLGNFSTGAVLGNFLAVAAVPAVVEEMFFRGFLVGTLRRMVPLHVAVWVGALIFSLFHFQFYGFFSRLFLGALLGYYYAWSGNLFTSILAHFVHNAVTLAIYLLALRGTVDPAILEDDFGFGWALALASACITLVLLYLYSRHSRKRKTALAHE